MRSKIFTGLFTFFLLFTFCTAVCNVQAQKRGNEKASKPNDKAKKLLAEGNKLFVKKDYRGAIGKYAEAIVLSPNYAEAHFWKGYAHYYLNEFNESGEELDAAFSQGYAAEQIYKVRWIVNFQKQNYEAALNDVQKGLEKEKNNVDYINALGEILVKKGSYKEAITALQNALKRNPNNGDLHHFLALSYSKTGDYVQQGVSADNAIKNNTKFIGETYILLGDSNLNAKKPGEAINYYQRALNVKDDLPEEFYDRFAQLYRSENRLGEAIDVARKGLKIYPKSSPLLINLTWYYSLADRHGEAVGAGEQAVRNAPDDSGAYTNLCRAYNNFNKLPQAIKACNDALKLTPNDGETFFYLGYAYTLSNKPALAADYYKKAVVRLSEYVRANPTNADGFYLLGNAYISDQQPKKAIEAYKESLKLSPNFVKAHYNLGNSYITDNNLAEARQEYNALLPLDKTYAEKLKKSIDTSGN